MTEQRCGLCRHWRVGTARFTDRRVCHADPHAIPTEAYEGTACDSFQERLTKQIIRERWPHLWEWMTCSRDAGALDENENWYRHRFNDQLQDRAREQLFEALGVEE